MKTRSMFMAMVAALMMPAFATAAEDGDWRVGLLAGQVGLLGDVGDDDPNSVGYGITAGHYVREDLVIEGMYLASSHTSVTHNELSFGANYFLGDYVAAYPNLSAGVAFMSNKVKPQDVTGDAFSLYVGGGFDFEINSYLSTGIQARFNKAFEGKTRIGGRDVTTVDDTLTVLLRFMYYFGSEE